MPRHRLTHISDPAVLQTVAPQMLAALLRPYAAQLRSAGVDLPDSDPPAAPDYEQLTELFVRTPEHIPEELIEALFLIDGLATPDSMDILLRAFPQINPPWHAWTPADVAVEAWLLDRERCEQVYAERQVSRRSRKFVAYAARGPELPDVALTPAATAAMERELDAALIARGRGGGVRLFVTSRADGTWFFIRRGEPLCREACLDEGRSSSVFFRPERYDAVVWDARRHELRINAASRWQKELYRRTFGRHLCGDAERFPSDDRYTLTPLVTDGRAALVCSDVPGLAAVQLVQLEYVEPGLISHGTVKWADDLFALIAAGCWSIPPRATLVRAKFSVHLTGVRTARTVTVAPPNEVQYALESDGLYVEQWLENRGFVIADGDGGEGDEDDVDFEPVLAFPGATGGPGGGVNRVEALFGA